MYFCNSYASNLNGMRYVVWMSLQHQWNRPIHTFLTHSAPCMFACIVPQALDVIKHCYSPARFTHTVLTFMELQISRVLNQNGY